MKFGIIDPKAKSFDVVDVDEAESFRRAGLDRSTTGHGIMWRMSNDHRVCMFCYDFAFYVPPAEQHYYAVGDRLFAGPAVIYEANRYGQTVPLSDEAVKAVDPVWFDDAEQVEVAIAAGAVIRPELAINGDVVWSWPEPPPPDIAEKMTS